MTITIKKCAVCQAVFGKWAEYNTHHKDVHGMFGKVLPEKTTDRTKAMIVSDFEKANPQLFLREPEPACPGRDDGYWWI